MGSSDLEGCHGVSAGALVAGVLAVGLFAAPEGRAQTQPSLAAQSAAVPSLTPGPALQLTLPPPKLGQGASQEGAASRYRLDPGLLRQWRYEHDDQLRLELETSRFPVGAFSLTGQLSSTPASERDCHPNCRGAGWSSGWRLQLDTGDLGPLRQTGFFLEYSAKPEPERGMQRTFRSGFGGKF